MTSTLTCRILRGALLAGLLEAAGATNAITFPELPCGEVEGEAVLFGFDRAAFPFQDGVQTHLVAGQNPISVLRPGPPGSHDEFTRFYGTVLRIDGQYHMWYWGEYGPELTQIGLGQGGHEDRRAASDPRQPLLCYARSKDGVQWEKPALGLVDFKGSRANNLVDFHVAQPLIPAAAVLHDPAEPDASRRFKLVYEARYDGQARFCVAFSPDGLRWTPSPRNPVGPFFEMGGVAKFNGLYYVCGQDFSSAHQPFRARSLATMVSADFENWSPAAAVGLSRHDDRVGPSDEGDWNQREEVHLGAALWNRGTVLLGIYGQWHGHDTGDRRLMSVDLGLSLSHDGLHHVEPVPNFKLVAAREQPESANEWPALIQGQGFVNEGNRTLFWYAAWRGRDDAGIRMVSWERDRLGYVRPFREKGGQVISTRFALRGPAPAALRLNVAGLGPNARVRVSLVDGGFRPVPGYSGVAAATVTENGLEVPVTWAAKQDLPAHAGDLRMQIEFLGTRPEDVRLYSAYLRSGTKP
ncbi:MAG: hypothetical protein EXS38_00775 [Opitutus sp.]|nr:hypothetical protein [Opitutus sp.]